MIEFEQPSLRNEVVGASVRVLKVAPQAVELLVNATMVKFEVQAELVSSNSNALRRFHFFQDVYFVDGTNGDNGFVMIGAVTWPDESVVFSDDGFVIFQPIDIAGALEEVIFTEIDFRNAWSISNTEFVQFMDYSIFYILDLFTTEQFIFTDMSISWDGVFGWFEQVNINESVFVLGGNNTLTLRESVNISETVVNSIDLNFAFGDAVTMFEVYDFIPAFPTIEGDGWIVTDALVVSEVAATDSRPGAFIPGSALLGSPQ